jgi:ketosteroid isomerase-like protein
MSRENVEVVQQPLTLKARPRRRLEERLGLRFPRVLALVAKAVWRLPRRSRLRRALMRHAVASGWEAFNRGDLEATFALYHPHVESTFDPGLIAVGLEGARGRDERIAVQRQGLAGFREFRFESEALIDLGDARLLLIGRMKRSGFESGAAFDNDWAALLTVAAGRVIREQIFLNRAEALEAVGLRE